MQQIIDDNIREQLATLAPHAGDLVSLKYRGGSHSITVVGLFGRSTNAPYLVKSDGTHFAIRPTAVFTQSTYEFTSIDIAIYTQREQFLREVEKNGVELPFPLTDRTHQDDPKGPKRYDGEVSRALEERAKEALESADDARDAIQDIRARMRSRGQS